MNTTALNNDLLSYLKGAQVGAEIMLINLLGAADIDPQLNDLAPVIVDIFIYPPAKRFKNLHRVVVRGDIVTKVPSWPYTHVGQHYYFGNRCAIAKIEKHYQGEYLSELVGINFDEAKGGAK